MLVESMNKRELSYTAGNIDWYSHYGEQCGDSLKKTGNRTATQPSNPTAGLTHRGNQNWKRQVYPNVHCSTVYILPASESFPLSQLFA